MSDPALIATLKHRAGVMIAHLLGALALFGAIAAWGAVLILIGG